MMARVGKVGGIAGSLLLLHEIDEALLAQLRRGTTLQLCYDPRGQLAQRATIEVLGVAGSLIATTCDIGTASPTAIAGDHVFVADDREPWSPYP